MNEPVAVALDAGKSTPIPEAAHDNRLTLRLYEKADAKLRALLHERFNFHDLINGGQVLHVRTTQKLSQSIPAMNSVWPGAAMSWAIEVMFYGLRDHYRKQYVEDFINKIQKVDADLAELKEAVEEAIG